MSFTFNFNAEGIENEDGLEQAKDVEGKSRGTAKRLDVQEMIKSLPLQVSYSRLQVPTNKTDSRLAQVYRRDLFDARFQMIHEDDDEEDEQSASAGQSRSENWKDVMADATTDLLPGVYEGGLKTWECSLDLANVLLHDQLLPNGRRFARVLELGCGTAIPSLTALSAFLLGGGKEQETMTLQLCDFNEQVLRLVTLPNIILTWYFASTGKDDAVNAVQGDLELSEELLEAFTSDLKARGVKLEFYSGHWDALEDAGVFADGLPNVVLTSETIYSMDTMPSLVDVLQRASCSSQHGQQPVALCLVAAKVLYFGVGGGVYAFEQELKRRRAHTQTIWKSDQGVARVVLQVAWQS